MPPKQITITTEAIDVNVEYETFDEAYAVLMASLEPGGWIDLHEETCSLVADETTECTCTPHRITKGAQA